VHRLHLGRLDGLLQSRLLVRANQQPTTTATNHAVGLLARRCDPPRPPASVVASIPVWRSDAEPEWKNGVRRAVDDRAGLSVACHSIHLLDRDSESEYAVEFPSGVAPAPAAASDVILSLSICSLCVDLVRSIHMGRIIIAFFIITLRPGSSSNVNACCSRLPFCFLPSFVHLVCSPPNPCAPRPFCASFIVSCSQKMSSSWSSSFARREGLGAVRVERECL